jgi:TonB-linked SusC/RagA family outer membrane protein
MEINTLSKKGKVYIFFVPPNFALQMKLITMLMILAIPQLWASGYSQKITLERNNVPLEAALKAIEQETPYLFLYDKMEVPYQTKVSVKVKNGTIEQVLNQLLAGLPLTYKVFDRNVVIRTEEKKGAGNKNSSDSEPKKADDIRIKGRVVDEGKGALPGANVLVKGTQRGVVTDVDGNFEIDVPDAQSVLVVSFVGYLSVEKVVNNQSLIEIVMVPDKNHLEELVVVGYGSQKKVTLTGSVSSITGEKIKNNPVANVSQALQGTIAGATVTNTNTPGGDSKIRIRGLSTINNNNPLWIVDGVPRTGGINQMSPSEIESVTVLKDASATAIYGARGANGVILVTTIKGRKSQPAEVSFSARIGTMKNFKRYDMLNTQEYADLLWMQAKNSGIKPSHPIFGSGETPHLPQYLIPAGADQVDESQYNRFTYPITKFNHAGTDWYKEILNSGFTRDYSLSIVGGSENTVYGFAASALKEDGMVKMTGFDRYNVRSNISFNVTKWLEIGESFGLSYTNDRGLQTQNSEGSIFGQLLDVAELMPVYDIQGNWAPLTRLTGIQANLYHPLAELDYYKDSETQNLTFIGNMYAKANITNNLAVKSQYGLNYGHTHTKTPLEINPESYVARTFPELSESYNKGYTWNWVNTIEYKNTFKGKHNLDVLAGSEALGSVSQSLGASRNRFIVTTPSYWVIDAGEGNIQNSGSMSDWSTFSLFGRVNYDFKDKYLLTLTLRRDGSSRFGSNNRYGMFPAVSAGWVLSDESFINRKTQSWLNFAKLRLSWGKSGNDQIGNYNSFTTFNQNRDMSYYPINGNNNELTTGFQSAVFGNPNAKWETTATTNLGLDLTVFNKLFVELDFWQRSTRDMLYQVSIPMVNGQATVPSVNIGDMDNRGIDFQIDYRNQSKNAQLKYNVGMSLTHYRNKIVKLSENESEVIIGGAIRDQIYTRAQIGTSFPQFFGYQVDGIFQTAQEVGEHPIFGSYNAPGRFKFRDVNQDGVIDDKDRTYVGNPHPDLTIGLNSSVQYKNFDLGLQFYTSLGNDIMNVNRRALDFNLFQKNRSKRRLYESWGSPYLANNADAKMPIAEINDVTSQLPSSYYVEDGSFLRFQSAQLGYTVPKRLLNKIAVRELRLSAMVTNLFTITKYSGLDPQIQTSDSSFGVDIGEWPTPRRFVIGLNFKF